jgi:hypothetical protein
MRRSLFVTKEEIVRTLLGAEQTPPSVRRAVLTEVPEANGTFVETLLFVAHITNATLHKPDLS